MTEEIEEEVIEEAEDQIIRQFYGHSEIIINEVNEGMPITEKHEEVLWAKVIKEVDDLPSLVVQRTKQNMEDLSSVLEDFLEYELLPKKLFMLNTDPAKFSETIRERTAEIEKSTNFRTKELKRAAKAIYLTIANQQSLLWEFLPRMKALQKYIEFQSEKIAGLGEQVQKLKEGKAAKKKTKKHKAKKPKENPAEEWD